MPVSSCRLREPPPALPEAGPGAGCPEEAGEGGSAGDEASPSRLRPASQPAAGRARAQKPAEPPGSGSNGTAGPVCVAAAASRGMNKLVRSQNVSSLDGRRDSSRLYCSLATLGSSRAVPTAI